MGSPHPSDPSRAAALKLLAAALSSRGGLEAALADPAFLKASLRDRAFARALVMMTLRRLGQIDRLLDARLAREPPAPVRDILRLGASQAFWLNTPVFAAVSTTVDLAPRGLRGLVNAVMRRLLDEGPGPDDPQALAPPWLLARWRANFGEASASRIAAQIAVEPATDLTPLGAPDPALINSLGASVLAGGSLRTDRRGDPASWPGYREGRWWMQDAAAAIPARLVGARQGETILDLCAAPGGKALQLAASGASVTALDRSASRLRRLSAGLERTGLQAELVTADAVLWNDRRSFDAVLLDAPCTATGTFRRHPDVLWNAKPGDIASLAQVQTALLAAAAARVNPGGRLVYSVCSLEPEEGEALMVRFLSERADFVPAPASDGECGAPSASLTPAGWLRILPHHAAGGMDGFFVARLARRTV